MVEPEPITGSTAQCVPLATGQCAPLHTPRFVDDYPAIRNWKTSVGFSLLGCIAIIIPMIVMIIAVLLSYALDPSTTPYVEVIGQGLWIIIYTLYAAIVYPTYFTKQPFCKSSRLISFFNLFFGGPIFGCLWNSNLTKSNWNDRPHKGCSNVVAVVISVITIVSMLVSLLLVSFPSFS